MAIPETPFLTSALSKHHVIFHRVATASCVLFATLFVVLRFGTANFQSFLGLVVSPALVFFGQRASYLFLGLAVLAYFSQTLTDAVAIRAISKGLAVMFIGLIANGIQGYVAGHTNSFILAAIGVEVIFTLAFVYLARASFSAPLSR